jgi:hypothetical protein
LVNVGCCSLLIVVENNIKSVFWIFSMGAKINLVVGCARGGERVEESRERERERDMQLSL